MGGGGWVGQGREERDKRGKKGKGQIKEHVQRTHGQGQCGGGLNVGGGGWVGQERVMGGKWGQL